MVIHGNLVGLFHGQAAQKPLHFTMGGHTIGVQICRGAYEEDAFLLYVGKRVFGLDYLAECLYFRLNQVRSERLSSKDVGYEAKSLLKALRKTFRAGVQAFEMRSLRASDEGADVRHWRQSGLGDRGRIKIGWRPQAGRKRAEQGSHGRHDYGFKN